MASFDEVKYKTGIAKQLITNAQKNNITLQEWAILIRSYCEFAKNNLSDADRTTLYNALLGIGKQLKARTLDAIELEQIFDMEKALLSNNIETMIITLSRLKVEFGRNALGEYQCSTPKLFTSNPNAIVTTGYLADYLNGNNREYTLLMRNLTGQTSGNIEFFENWTQFAELLFICDDNTESPDLWVGYGSNIGLNVINFKYLLERFKTIRNGAKSTIFINTQQTGGYMYTNEPSKLTEKTWYLTVWSQTRIFEIWGVKYKQPKLVLPTENTNIKVEITPPT